MCCVFFMTIVWKTYCYSLFPRQGKQDAQILGYVQTISHPQTEPNLNARHAYLIPQPLFVFPLAFSEKGFFFVRTSQGLECSCMYAVKSPYAIYNVFQMYLSRGCFVLLCFCTEYSVALVSPGNDALRLCAFSASQEKKEQPNSLGQKCNGKWQRKVIPLEPY